MDDTNRPEQDAAQPGQHEEHHQHGEHVSGGSRAAAASVRRRTRVIWAIIAAIAAIALVIGAVTIVRMRGDGADNAAEGTPTDANTSAGAAGTDADHDTTPAPDPTHHGNSPDCPDQDCIAIMANGDLLFHEGLWSQFQGPDPNATDGTAFDFTPLFELMGKYIGKSDIAVCNFETPVAQRGGPYSAYPIFNIPPEVADAAAKVGYKACTHATNHSWDQGADGIARTWDTLAADGIAQTGSYKSEEESTKPLVIDSPTGGGKLGLLAGTVSLNGMSADQDWQVDRLREDGEPEHQADIDRAVAKAKKAREQGADVVALAFHSVQEYIDYADSWQVSEAHQLADTGQFDVLIGTGSHAAQPIEYYNGTWILYGLGNAVTESANTPETLVNNQGVTARIQLAGKKGQAGTWRVTRIDWLPTANVRQGKYQWCPLAEDHPDGTCWDESQDAQVRQRIHDVLYSMGADQNVVREWKITDENAG